MKKRINWEQLSNEEQQMYIERAMNIDHSPLFKTIKEQASTPIGLKELQRLHQTELEEQRGNFNNMFKRWGRELFEKGNDDNNIKKWFLTDTPEQYIEAVSPLVNGKVGKELYAVILAMQRNKQLKSIGYNELSEFFRVLHSVFDIPNSRKSFSDAHRRYEEIGEEHIKKETITDIQAKLPQ